MKESKINILLLLTSVILSIVYFFIYLQKNDNPMAISSISSVILPFLPYIFEKIFKKKIPNTLKLIYLMLILFGVIIGSVIDLYDKSAGYDKIIHFFSGIITSIATIYIIKYIFKGNKPNMFTFILLMLAFNIATSGSWEIIEFMSDAFLGSHAQRGLTDTMQDMICALLGGILFLLIYTDKKRLN